MFRRFAAGAASFAVKLGARVMSAWARRQVQSIGQIPGQMQAMARQGANDLYNAIVPAFPQSQRGVEMPGTPLQPTQMATNNALGITSRYENKLRAQAMRPPSISNKIDM